MGFIQMSARKLVSYADRMQAEIVKSLLESNEIPVIIQNDSEIGYAGNPFSAQGFHLYVPEDLFEDALKLIDGDS